MEDCGAGDGTQILTMDYLQSHTMNIYMYSCELQPRCWFPLTLLSTFEGSWAYSRGPQIGLMLRGKGSLWDARARHHETKLFEIGPRHQVFPRRLATRVEKEGPFWDLLPVFLAVTHQTKDIERGPHPAQ